MKKMLKAIALIFIVTAVVFEAGCAQKATTPGNGTAENGQVVTGNDNGKTINLKNGENFSLILSNNPSTGYHWDVNVSKGLKILIGFDNGYPNKEPPGSPENYTWVIQATSPGSQQVKGDYRPPGDYGPSGGNKISVQNFTLNVEVV